MADFAKALEEGIASAKKTAADLKEIEQVFADLDQQIRNASNGKLSIVKEPDQILETQWGGKHEVSMIVAFNPTVAVYKKVLVAAWSQSRYGYPCTVMWGHQEHICEDKEALLNCLADLLRDPLIATDLLRLMNAGTPDPEIPICENVPNQ